MDGGYIKSLDGVRAIAILLVMSFHAEITHFGWMGVQLFFVLSGFLITGILWKEKYTEGQSPLKFKRFWMRRSLRIFPLYFGYLLFLGIAYLVVHFPSYYAVNIPYLVTYTFNYTRTFPGWQGNPLFTHLWSLSVEEQFYVFFPLVILLCPPRFIKWFLIFFIVASPVTRFFLGMYFSSKSIAPEVVADAVYWHTLSHLDAFFMGGVIPVLALDNKIKKPRRLFIASLVLVLLAGCLNFINTNSGTYYLEDLGYHHGQIAHYEYVWQYTVLNLLFASVVLLLISPHNRHQFSLLRTVMENKWMVRVGKVSYGMYVFHWAILVYFVAPLMPSATIGWKLGFFIPYVVVVYLVAAFSFRFYELYFIRLKDVFFAKSKKHLPAQPNSVALIKEPPDNL